ncbi:PGCA protein, partial [Amia calva]|nr:PGCA protein [Amia calva]
MDNIGGWFDDNCRHNHSFLCYQDTSDPIQKYILIDQVKSWTEAQRFCREKHTDLVSVRNQRENEEVTKAAKGQNVWIGLFRDPWKWSDKRSSSFRNWNTGEPNNFSGVDENCVTMYLDKDKRGKWNDDPCSDRFPFFCYQETNNATQRYVLIDQAKSWTGAQRFCREKHTDLVSVRNQSENKEVTKAANGQDVWLGMFRDPWKWSDKRNSSFRNWNSGEPNNGGGSENCANMYLEKSNRGKWNDAGCTGSLPFFCYHGELP